MLTTLKAALPGRGSGLPSDLLTREVTVDADHLAAYAHLCGFTLRDELPAVVKDGPIRPTSEEHRATAGPKLLEYLYTELERREAAGEPGDDLIGGFLTAAFLKPPHKPL